MNKPEEFEYDYEDATNVILQNISDELKSRLGFNDIIAILELKDEYFESIGVIEEPGKESVCTYPVDIDEEEMNLYVIKNAVQHDIILNMNEMEEIMAAELIYLDINGQLQDPTYLN